jgi:ubiquitin C-terminal hydrolase
MCLEPPLRVDELPKEDQWFCRKCKVERVSTTKRGLADTRNELGDLHLCIVLKRFNRFQLFSNT